MNPPPALSVKIMCEDATVIRPTVGSPLRAVLSPLPESIKAVRFFWFSLIAKSTTERALNGAIGNIYTPTKKLQGKCICVTVHFSDGSNVTSLTTSPVLAAGSSKSGFGALPPNIPSNPALKTLCILDYDTAAFDFRGAMQAYLGLRDTPPEQVHNAAAAAAAASVGVVKSNDSQTKGKKGTSRNGIDASCNAAEMAALAFAKQLSGIHDQSSWSRGDVGRGGNPDDGGDGISQRNRAIVELYDEFMDKVVAPAMGGGRVIYQAKPSLRVLVPGSKGIRFHRDADYMHQVRHLRTESCCLFFFFQSSP